jgi:hypothetical protein
VTIPPRLLRETSAILQGIELDAARAGELAVEVERLNAATRAAAEIALDFDTDPNAFAAILARHAG